MSDGLPVGEDAGWVVGYRAVPDIYEVGTDGHGHAVGLGSGTR